ncbi:MAG: hypothetical protein CMI67_21900 [Pelagibaca sp.]|nr:hypothetical protein [Pelagibaca sp.]
MVSDVDDVVESAPKQSQKTHSELPPEQSARKSTQQAQKPATKPASQTHQAPAQPSGGSSGGKWLIGIAVVIGLIWLANQSDNNRPSRSTYSPGSSTSTVPANQPSITQPQVPNRPSESKPSVGRNNVLSIAEIRYCLAEKIRLDAAETVLNNYSDSDVDRFNAYVNDYNSRCGEFRYRQGSLENARRDINPYSSQLQAEGRSRFVRSPATTARAPVTTPSSKPSRPTPDATVLAIQRRLNELGYNAGTPDGLFGNKTRAAIQAFQRDNGIAADGVASAALLNKLEEGKKIQRSGSATVTNPSPRPQSNGGLPANASVNYLGTGWECNRGYYKSGNGCRQVQIPENASLNYLGSGWECDRGYYKSGSGCLRVQIPNNASINYLGSGWECDRGYYKSGSECRPVKIPNNASLNYLGSGWECDRGYYKSGNGCRQVQIPNNASLNYLGSDWECDRGYYKSGSECRPVQIPNNANLNYLGSGWECNRGYRRVGDRCEAI